MGGAVSVESLLAAELDKREAMEQDFALYLKRAWYVLNPVTGLIWNWHLDAIAEHLDAVRLGQVKRLLINVPPKTAKSTVCSIAWPTWMWLRSPAHRFAFYSYAAELSTGFSIQRRSLITSDWYQRLWGDVFRLRPDENRTDVFSNDKTGRMTVLTSATGMGGDTLILDDPQSVSEALSDTLRAATTQMIRQSLMTRVNNAVTDAVILIMQRIHEKDISGELLSDGGWTHLNLPAVAQSTTKVYFPVSGKTKVFKKGDLLSPVLMPQEVLDQRQRELGTWGFSGQYLLAPAPVSGNIVNPDWWKWYDPSKVDIRAHLSQVVISVDTATKGAELSNDTSVQAWGFGLQQTLYFLSRDTRKMNFATTLASIKAMAARYGTQLLLIEDKSTGPAVIETLRDEGFVIVASTPTADKITRLQAASISVEAGTVYLPLTDDGRYLQRVCAVAPGGPMDDVDAASQIINYARSHGRCGGWLKAMAEEEERLQRGEISTDNSAYPSGTGPPLKQLYDGVRTELMNEKICIQPADRTLPVPRKPSISCPACQSARVLLAGISAKCRDCKTIFQPPSVRSSH